MATSRALSELFRLLDGGLEQFGNSFDRAVHLRSDGSDGACHGCGETLSRLIFAQSSNTFPPLGPDQSAVVEPRIEGVVAEDPFADLREVSYEYAGLRLSPFLGETFSSCFCFRHGGTRKDWRS